MLIANLILSSFLFGNGARPVVAEAPAHESFGVSLPKYKITRISRTATQIKTRANQAVAAFSNAIQLDQSILTGWANAAVTAPTEVAWCRPVVGDENIAVGYRHREDEVFVLNTYYLDLMPTSFPLSSTEDIGATAARAVMEDAVQDLIAAGFVRSGMPYSAATLSQLKEKHIDGTSSHTWTTEYIFTMNFVQNGITFPDIGLKIGVHRKGVVSSIHATDATLQSMGNTTTTLTVSQAQAQLASSLATSFPGATYSNIKSRQGALLNPLLSVETNDPSGIFNYVLVFSGGKSRQRISRVSLVSGAIQHLYL